MRIIFTCKKYVSQNGGKSQRDIIAFFGLFKFLKTGQILEHYDQFNSPLKVINILFSCFYCKIGLFKFGTKMPAQIRPHKKFDI